MGKDRSEKWARWHGGQSAGRRNEEGELILDFARRKDLAITNTFFMAKSEEQTCTYKSGNCQTVIDYIMLRREGPSSVKTAK